MLGFVGLCGVLKGPSSAPRAVRLVSGALVLLSLALACCATFLVGRVAWPLREGGGTAELLRVETAAGTACGTPVSSDGGTLVLDQGDQRTVVHLAQVTAVRPVAACP